MKLGKVENWETHIRIDQGIFNREGREVTRRGAGKDEIWKVENWETKIRIGPLTSDLTPLTSCLGFASVSPSGEN